LLTGIHFLLTYACTFECDHCFLYCSPFSEGTFTINQVKQIYDETDKIGTIDTIYIEGGEAFLYYPLMVEGARLAKEKGYKLGIVTNAYWANSVADAELWLKPLVDIGIDDFSVSDDEFHQGDSGVNTAQIAAEAAKNLGLPSYSIRIDKPVVSYPKTDDDKKGNPVIGGGAMFRGRAVEKLTPGLPTHPCNKFIECPHEELVEPKRVHIDPMGTVHICQGISMGNIWKTPLSELVKNYDATNHPICGPLVEGGPLRLAETYNVPHRDEYVDECHFCYEVRKALIDRFPEYLTPRQVYGLE